MNTITIVTTEKTMTSLPRLTTEISFILRGLVCASLCLTAATAAADEPPAKRNPAAVMKRADTDGDGKVSRDEFIKAGTARLEAMFARMDADGDGTLSQEEFASGAGRMREAMQKKGRGIGERVTPDRAARGPEPGFRRPPQQ
jgi:hypothetical protein